MEELEHLEREPMDNGVDIIRALETAALALMLARPACKRGAMLQACLHSVIDMKPLLEGTIKW
jgi:hypothetical protein